MFKNTCDINTKPIALPNNTTINRFMNLYEYFGSIYSTNRCYKHYTEPFFLNTTPTVLNNIFKYKPKEKF